MAVRKTKARKALNSRLDALLDFWREPLGLGRWLVEVRVYPNSKRMPGRPSRTARRANTDTNMSVHTFWQYQKAYISVNARQCLLMTADELEASFLHELSHVLVCEMREHEQHHEERTVQNLSLAFMWIRHAGYTEGLAAARAEQVELDLSAVQN